MARQVDTQGLRVASWAARIAFGAVLAMNVACAVQFLAWPGDFAGAYGLAGDAGDAAMRGFGVCFLMWNATYPLFIASPGRFAALGAVALAQQAIGLVGESAILASLPAGNGQLASSIVRFAAFDGAGLVLMGVAFAAFVLAKRKALRLQ